MNMCQIVFLSLALFMAIPLAGQPVPQLKISQNGSAYQVTVLSAGQKILSAPPEGLWSIAIDWATQWPSDWRHAAPDQMEKVGEWTILRGKLSLPAGEWLLRDAYREEGDKIKCIRRFEWRGEQTLEKVTLSARWMIEQTGAKAFLPGILYYGNPAGERNGSHKVPVYHGLPGEAAIFEEHRYPMPFASLEWEDQSAYFGAALHSIPSPVAGGHRHDQWWSMGVQTKDQTTELVLLTGPIAYNGQKSVAKALQRDNLPYNETYVQVKPGTVIEKTFYLQAYPVTRKGTAFQKPLYTSIDIFKPFYAEDLPTFDEIVRAKYRFARSRWIEGEGYAGFNMYPDFHSPLIVLGWAGQSEAPAYALQILADELKDEAVWEMAQRSMDHICAMPVEKSGFPVRFEVETGKWHSPDPVSEGQAMYSVALAIRAGRRNNQVDVSSWAHFLQKVCDIHSARLLEASWAPRNTAEAFYIAPLLISAQLFDNGQYRAAALKAADYYAARHLDMGEPYWGGTLDATCEDKEGAWGAFQGFMAAYEATQDPQYLAWAKHAGDVVLSYTVVWDIPLPAGRMADHYFKTRGWTGVSPQNQHLDVYGVLIAPTIYKLGQYTDNDSLKRLAMVMYRSCGQIIDPFGSQGEQIQQTNFAQQGEMSDVFRLRGGYSESWTVFWITAHFLHAAAQFKEMGVRF